MSLQTLPYCLHVHQAFCKILFSRPVLHSCDYHKTPRSCTGFLGGSLCCRISMRTPKAGHFTCFGIFFYKPVFKISVEKLFHRLFPLRLSYNMAISPTLPLFHHVALNQNTFSSSLPCGHLLVPFLCSWCSLHLAVCVCRVQHP